MSDIVESYKETTIDYLENSGPEDLLLHILHCLRVCPVDKDNWVLPMVLYCSIIVYKYYSGGLPPETSALLPLFRLGGFGLLGVEATAFPKKDSQSPGHQVEAALLKDLWIRQE